MKKFSADHHSEEHFRSLVRGILDVLMAFDSEGTIRYTSASSNRVLGYDPQELIGKNFFEFVHVEDVENTFYLFKNIEQDFSKPPQIEFRFLHRDGSWRTLETIGKSLIEEKGHLQVVVSLRDVTEQEYVEEALKQNTHRLLLTLSELQKTQASMIRQERLKALGQMASGIAHDFNNTLAPILGFSELILTNPANLKDEEKLTRYVKLIHTAAKDAVSIVGRLVEFYRNRDAEEDLFNVVDVNKIIEQTISLTQPKWKNQEQIRGTTITVETHLEVVPNILGNESALREALTNLVFNAVDAMPKGGTLRVQTIKDNEDALIKISDTGTGMSEEVQKRCFEPFFSTKGKSGTGMGLSMVHGIIRRHEGTIEIVSTLGQGTTFIIRLPSQGKTTKSATKQEKIDDKRARAMQILLVDDDELALEVAREYLAQDGHFVDTARSGPEALEKFKKGKYEVVISDRAMSPMNGDQLLEKIKASSPTTPTVMLTGFADLMKQQNEKPSGMDYLLGKPVTITHLRQILFKIAGGI